jgi:hypothetical protein
VIILRDVAVPAPWGFERLPGVILHRRGAMVVETQGIQAVGCMAPDGGSTPCRPVLDAYRRTGLLRQHLVRRSRHLFPGRFRPGRFAAGLEVEGVILMDPPPPCSMSDGRNGNGETCAVMVMSLPDLRLRVDRVAGTLKATGRVMRPRDMTALAADLCAPRRAGEPVER